MRFQVCLHVILYHECVSFGKPNPSLRIMFASYAFLFLCKRHSPHKVKLALVETMFTIFIKNLCGTLFNTWFNLTSPKWCLFSGRVIQTFKPIMATHSSRSLLCTPGELCRSRPFESWWTTYEHPSIKDSGNCSGVLQQGYFNCLQCAKHIARQQNLEEMHYIGIKQRNERAFVLLKRNYVFIRLCGPHEVKPNALADKH